MPADWHATPFRQLLAEPLRNGIYKPKEFHGHGAKIVNMGELFAHPRLRAVPMKRVELSTSEKERFLLSKGDLLFARRSLVAEGAGKCSIVLELDEPTTFESSIIRARPDTSKAEPLYLYYFFSSSAGYHRLDTIRRQVAVSGITGSDLAKLEIPTPSPSVQRAIAHLLGTLDDKIELNRRTSQTLVEMASALFRSWFVDFEGVVAKAAGREPSGIERASASLFPSRFQDSELGPIPSGWHVNNAHEAAQVIYGAAFASSLFNVHARGHPLIRIRDLAEHDPQVWTTEQHPRRTLISPGDIVVGMDGEFRAHVWRGPEAWLNQRVCKFCPHEPYGRAFVYFSLQEPLAEVERSEVGTTVIHLGKADIDRFRIVYATDGIHRAFHARVDPLVDLAVQIGLESRTLSRLRDALLPKLISGDICLRDVERTVEAVA